MTRRPADHSGSTAIPNNTTGGFRVWEKGSGTDLSTPILSFFGPRAFKASILTQNLHRVPEVNAEKDLYRPVSRYVLFFDASDLLIASGDRERPRTLPLTRRPQGDQREPFVWVNCHNRSPRLRFWKDDEFVHSTFIVLRSTKFKTSTPRIKLSNWVNFRPPLLVVDWIRGLHQILQNELVCGDLHALH